MFNSMFNAFKPALETAGVKPGRNWLETREKIRRQAVAQLRRNNLKPATVVKWHRLGVMVGVGQN